ncbi:hypothetical protein C5167_006228 [Papaver somniferum]|uniref:Uncharacterized protein n=1 Tax=Papaver somniferum TaxID=3469 RepID=A0A4Y7JFW9_PAPSO|nr:hypothetical protein C5167_006228 [Papaver somniferum]
MGMKHSDFQLLLVPNEVINAIAVHNQLLEILHFGVSNRVNMSALQPLVRRGSAKMIKDDTVCNHVVAEATKIAAAYQTHNIDNNKVVVAPGQVPVTATRGAELKLSPLSSYDTMGSGTLPERCLRDILKVIKPLGGDVTARYTIISDLRTVVGSIDSLKGATVEPFGSFVSNLYSRWGDLDISIEIKEWAKSQQISDPKNGTLNSHSLCLLVIFHFQTILQVLTNNHLKFDKHAGIRIEDPFQHADNTARTVSMSELGRICEVFDEAYQGLVSSDHDRTSLICSLVRHPISTKIISPHSNPGLFSGASTRYCSGQFREGATRYRLLSDALPPPQNQFNNMQTESDEATIIAIRRELAQLMLKANTRNKPRAQFRSGYVCGVIRCMMNSAAGRFFLCLNQLILKCTGTMGKLCRVEEAHLQLHERLQRSAGSPRCKEKSELESRLNEMVEPNKENAVLKEVEFVKAQKECKDTMEKLCRVIEVPEAYMVRYMKSDPVKIATEWVERFKKENCDFTIVDACGCHQQEASLFEEMHQLAESTVIAYVLQEQEPHAAEISEIIARFECKGYKLAAIKLVVPSKDFAQKHNDDLKKNPFSTAFVISSVLTPVLAMVRERRKQVSSLYKLYKMGN